MHLCPQEIIAFLAALPVGWVFVAKGRTIVIQLRRSLFPLIVRIISRRFISDLRWIWWLRHRHNRNQGTQW